MKLYDQIQHRKKKKDTTFSNSFRSHFILRFEHPNTNISFDQLKPDNITQSINHLTTALEKQFKYRLLSPQNRAQSKNGTHQEFGSLFLLFSKFRLCQIRNMKIEHNSGAWQLVTGRSGSNVGRGARATPAPQKWSPLEPLLLEIEQGKIYPPFFIFQIRRAWLQRQCGTHLLSTEHIY